MSVGSIAFVRFVVHLDEPGGVALEAPLITAKDGDRGPAGGERHGPDLTVDTDPWGRPHIPGTSLAGALRALLQAHPRFTDKVGQVMGMLTVPDPSSGEVAAVASRIWVLGTRLLAEDGSAADPSARPELVSRSSTAIDRKRRAARLHTLRTDEFLPAGTTFEAFVRWDDPDTEDWQALMAALSEWQPLLGRGVSRGRGRCSVREVAHGALAMSDPADLLTYLTASGPNLVRRVATTVVPVDTAASADHESILDVRLRIAGTIRVGSGLATPGQDGRLVSRMVRENSKYVVTAETLKGLLRSRIEFILRSVAAEPRPCLVQDCGKCWPCSVFGYGGAEPKPSAQSVGGRGRTRFHTTVIEDAVRVKRQHVAIDRFSGGGQDALLYRVEALEEGHFRIRISSLGLPEADVTRLRALTRLVLADLTDGLIGVGGGTTRGYGSVELEQPDGEGAEPPSVAEAQSVLRTMVAEKATAAS